jgi:hypothetical protein
MQSAKPDHFQEGAREMVLVCEAAESRDLGEAFIRIVRQQPLCTANATNPSATVGRRDRSRP